MRDEVLEDHLLQMAVARVHARERLERGDALVLRLADPDQDAARERDLELARGLDRPKPRSRVLGRRAGVNRLHEPFRDRLEHQAHGRVHLAKTRQLLRVEHPEVRVREHPALERALTCPDDVRGEVVVPVLGEAPRDLRVELGLLAGEHEQLLAAAPGCVVEQALDLVRRVQMRLMCRERAVLAVAAAGTRQRQRVVP